MKSCSCAMEVNALGDMLPIKTSLLDLVCIWLQYSTDMLERWDSPFGTSEEMFLCWRGSWLDVCWIHHMSKKRNSSSKNLLTAGKADVGSTTGTSSPQLRWGDFTCFSCWVRNFLLPVWVFLWRGRRFELLSANDGKQEPRTLQVERLGRGLRGKCSSTCPSTYRPTRRGDQSRLSLTLL